MSDAVIVAAITGIVTIIVQLFTLIGAILIKRSLTAVTQDVKGVKDVVDITHIAVDGRLSKLLELTEKSFMAKGITEGKLIERANPLQPSNIPVKMEVTLSPTAILPVPPSDPASPSPELSPQSSPLSPEESGLGPNKR